MIQVKDNRFSGEKELQILNFYSPSCPPCHAFMPNFIEAEKTFGEYFDFVAINAAENMQLFQEFGVMSTPTIMIIKGDKIIYNKVGVPNGAELKKLMMTVAEIDESDLIVKSEKKKRFFGLF